MGRRSRQSIFKRQRELRKVEKAAMKREKRQGRRHKDATVEPQDGSGPAGSQAVDESGDEGPRADQESNRSSDGPGVYLRPDTEGN